MINILEKIRAYRLERNWTEYQLAEKSNLPQSTISSWYRKNQIPTIPSLEKICTAFNVTLAQFLTEETENATMLTARQTELLHYYNMLSKNQQHIIIELLQSMGCPKMREQSAVSSETRRS